MSKFLKDFDSTNVEHVNWLCRMTKSKAANYVSVLESNPMGLAVEPNDALDWAQIVLVLCTKYTKDLFDDKAVILSSPTKS
jgi:hypothetical protein